MRSAVALMLLFCGTSVAEELDACKRDDECVVIAPLCSPMVAVNRKHEVEARAAIPRQNCLGTKVTPPPAVCRKGRCGIEGSLDGLGGAPADPTGHKFDGPVATYVKAFDDPKRDKWQRPAEVVKILALAPGMTVADIGAGTGYFEGHLDRAVGAGGLVLALDVEPSFISWLGERGKRDGWARVEARLVPRDDPQLGPGTVDRVLIVDTWHHIGGREAYAAKLAAALKPGGKIVIVEVTPQSPHGPPAKHRLAPKQAIAELEAAGLRATVVKEGLPRQYVVVGERPQR